MGKISNKRIYETVTPTGSDYLIGTDAEDKNKTKNFKIQAIADFVGQNVTIGVGSLNTLTGALTLVGGDGLTITDNGSDTITISMDRPDYVESINSLIGAVDIVGSTNIVITDNGTDTITVDTQNLAKTNEPNNFVKDQTMTKNLSVGTTVFNVDSIAGRVGINTATPSKSFDVVGGTIIQGLTGDVLTLKSPSENGEDYILFTNSLDSDKGWVGYRGSSNVLQIDNLIDDIDISSLTGSVKLSLGGSVKLETKNTGVNVAGKLTATGATITGDILVNGLTVGKGGTGLVYNNTAIGFSSLSRVTTGNSNTAIGYIAGSFMTTGENNTAVGAGSLRDATIANKNTAIGADTLSNNLDGNSNTAVGHRSLYVAAGATENTAVGSDSLTDLTTAIQNTAVGSGAGANTTTGESNTAVGYRSLFRNLDGRFNVAMGLSALSFNTSGDSNVALGKQSLINIEGDENIGIGKSAGELAVVGNKNVGSRNIFIGADTKSALSASTINEIVIGDGAEGNGSNTVTLGNDIVTDTYLKGDVSVTGDVVADSHVTNGGTSSDFVKGDGSLDSTNYQGDIEAEEAARIASDNTLQSNIDSEAATRLANDNTLQANIDTEEAARISADAVLQGGINAEGLTRQSADADLQSQIDSNDTDISNLQSSKQDISEKGQANGYAPLDSGAKIPIANLPDSVVGQVEYQGTWNASTDTPTLPAASGVKGHYYVTSGGGTYEGIVYADGDWIISNGTLWEKVDNTDAVTTVFGRIGPVVANLGDYALYYPPITRTISAGTGLTGGGDLSANRTISHDDTSSQGSVNNIGGTVIQDVTLDGFGHVTGLASVDLDGRYVQTLTDTLDSVTDRGATTTNTITVGNIILSNITPVEGTFMVTISENGTLSTQTIPLNSLNNLDSVTTNGSSTSNTITVGGATINGDLTTTGTVIATGSITTSEFTNWSNKAGNPNIPQTGLSMANGFNQGYLSSFGASSGVPVPLNVNVSAFNITGNLTTTGSIGIGTSTPSAKLFVSDTDCSIVVAASNTSGVAQLSLKPIGSDGSSVGDAIIKGIPEGSDQATAMTFTLRQSGGTRTERMRIDSSGNVGIGTSSPADIVDIQKNQNATTNFYFRNTDTTNTSSRSILNVDAGNVRLHFQVINNDHSYISASSNIYVQAASESIFWTGGSESMRITSSGNVGIGTSNPNANLEVYRSDFPALRLSNANAFSNIYQDPSGVINYSSDDGATAASSGHIFYVDGTERMRIDSSGNLTATGTTTTKKLTVSGSLGADWSVGITNTSTSGHGLIIQAGGTTGTRYITQWKDALGTERFHMDDTGEAYFQNSITATGAVLSSSGSPRLVIESSASFTFPGINFSNSVTSYELIIRGNQSDAFQLRNSNTGADLLSVTPTGNLTTTGNVGIGTSPSIDKLTVLGNVVISGSLSKGSGSFKIDHPLEEKKDTHHLVHSFVEAPQADNIYRGKVELSEGKATVNLDEAGRMTEGTFVLLNGNIQCFTSNESGWAAIRGKVDGNILTIEAQDGECTDTISWLVIGERIDQHMIDTEWTDENGRVITEPLKKVESTPENNEEETTIIENN